MTLAQEKHFGRAAQSCHVSQPALSGGIQSLEQELGVPIVRRGQRFEGFTEEGMRVLLWARRVLADCEHLRQEIQTHDREPTGVLRLGTIPTALPLVPLLTEKCLVQYPQIRHVVYTLSATQTLRQLTDFELDIGLSYLEDERLQDFYTVPLFQEHYVLIARDETMLQGRTTIAWQEAAQLPLCLFTDNMQCRSSIDTAFANVGLKVVPRVETDSMMALYAHVRCAGLFSVVPHSVLCLLEMRQEITAIPLVPKLQRDIGLVLLNRQPLGRLLTAAMESFHSLDLQTRVDALLQC